MSRSTVVGLLVITQLVGCLGTIDDEFVTDGDDAESLRRRHAPSDLSMAQDLSTGDMAVASAPDLAQPIEIGVCNGNCIYVGPSATGNGNGSDWNNKAAWSSATFVRGRTYYLQDGSYSARTWSTANSGTTRIIIKKAIASDHGTDAGWNTSSMGSGQAVFTGATVILTDHWTFDGQTGGGPGSWKTGFGFRIEVSDNDAAGFVAPAAGGPQTHGLLFRHFEIHGPAGGGIDNGKPNMFHMYGTFDTTVEYFYGTDSGNDMWDGGGHNILWQYCYFGSIKHTPSTHGEVFSTWGSGGQQNITVRWNIIMHTEGTGGFMFANDGGPGGYEVYGNVFAPLDGHSLMASNGVVGTWSAATMTGLKVHNNTFIGWSSPVAGIFDGNDNGEFRNNLFYDGTSFGSMTLFPCSHNHFASAGPGTGTSVTTSTGDPFVNWSGADFRTTANTPPGTNLGAPYNVDMFGNTRTTWTRGAIEFVQ